MPNDCDPLLQALKDPTPAMLAAADQKHAAVSAVVDLLVASARAFAQPGPTGWLRFTAEHMIAAVVALADDDEDTLPVALAVASEAVLRLALQSAPQTQQTPGPTRR